MSKGGARWRRFQLVVPANEAHAAAALLEVATGALSATENRAAIATVSVYAPEASARKSSARVRLFLERARRRHMFDGARLTSTVINEEDWASSWKRFYRPFRIAPKLYVAPTWAKRFRAPRGSHTLRIDPGMAFGTGQHPTTRLALALLLEHTRRRDTVLDIGCGSGLLALAAAQRGAVAYAADADPVAVHVTQANFEANHLKAAEIRRARNVPGSFPRAHVICANITPRVLANCAVAFSHHLLPNGVLVASGFSARSRGALKAAMQAAGLRFVTERASGPWLAHLYRKR